MAPKPTPYRAKDGTITWQVRYRIAGAPNPVKDTFDTQADAEKFARLVDAVGGAAARATRRKGEGSARTALTLATYLEVHLQALSSSVTPGTVAEYRRMAARTWLPSLGNLPLEAIDRDAVVTWVGWQRRQITNRSKPYSPKSIANAHGFLSSVLAAAVEAGHITRNVARAVPLPSDAERTEMVFLTENEFVELHQALPERWRTLVALLYSTGLRWGEATALTPADLNLDGPVPTLRVTRAWKKGADGVYLGSPKTRKSRRTVALAPDLVPALRALCDGKRSDELVFTAAQGGRVSAQHFHARVWLPAIKRSRLAKRPRIHDLRHTHAALMIARGMDVYELQRRLGHESMKTTGDVYAHLMPDVHMRGSAHAAATLSGAYPQIES